MHWTLEIRRLNLLKLRNYKTQVKELGRNDGLFGHISEMEITICGRRSSFTGNILVCECESVKREKNFENALLLCSPPFIKQVSLAASWWEKKFVLYFLLIWICLRLFTKTCSAAWKLNWIPIQYSRLKEIISEAFDNSQKRNLWLLAHVLN